MSKVKRPGKIYLDYLRNERGATAVDCVFDAARPGNCRHAPSWTSCPVQASRSIQYETVPRRLEAMTRDPWDGFLRQPNDHEGDADAGRAVVTMDGVHPGHRRRELGLRKSFRWNVFVRCRAAPYDDASRAGPRHAGVVSNESLPP